MAAFVVYRIVSVLLCLLIINHITSGLLSDYKICGDAECESKISRVEAVRDHHSKDCRFLSFRRGDIILVYHKLTGKRKDLWAGSIEKRFGYFPKDAVKEEEIYATAEKVLETQKSDFFCMDEDGYPIDTSELDDNEIINLKINEPDVTKTSPQPPSEEWHQENVEPITKSVQDKVDSKEEEPLKEQDGSASSAWLGSSMTGLLGIVKSDDYAGAPKEDKTAEKGESSLASSVTGWLGLGGKNQDKSSKEAKEEDIEASGTITSTMTGWLGFGSDSKVNGKGEEESKSEEESHPGEVFRSRRIALDLEGDMFNPEKKEETGTLGWLGSGISNTLGFGFTNEDAKQEAKSEESQENAKPVSSSWFDVGITDILGLRKDVDMTEKSISDQIQKDRLSEQNIDSHIVTPPEDPKQTELRGDKIEETEAKASLDNEIKHYTDENNSDKTSSSSDIVIESNDQESEQEKLHPTQDSFHEHQNTEIIKNIKTEEAIVIKSEPIYEEVIHDQDVVQQIQENAAEKNTNLLTPDSKNDDLKEDRSKLEATAAELQRNQEEISFESVDYLENSIVSETEPPQVNSGQELEETKEDIQENKTEIQEVVFEKHNMSEEVTENTQEVVDNDKLKVETMGAEDNEDAKIQREQEHNYADKVQKDEMENKFEYVENVKETGYQNYEEVITEGRSEEMEVVHEETKQDLVEEKNDKLKETKWQVDEVGDVTMDHIEQIQKVEEVIEENGEDKLDIFYDNVLDGVKNADDERNESNKELKENFNILKETEDIESEMQDEEMGEYAKNSKTKVESTEVLEEIVLADSEDSTDKREDNQWEKSHQKDKEENAFENIKSSPVLTSDKSGAIELNDQIAEKYDENIIMEVNKESLSREDVNTDDKLIDNDRNTDEYKAEEEVATSLSENVLNEMITTVSYEPGASPADGYKKQSEHGEAIGLFQNAFSYFSNSVNSSDTRDYDRSMETNIGESTQPHDNIKIEEETNSVSDFKNLSTVSPSTQPLSEKGSSIMTVNQKTLNKFYCNILKYMNADEAAILIHLFGDHKLQFLDYILGSPDTAATDEDQTDKSILLDIESLQQYHMETMMAARTRSENVPQEDKDKTKTVIALQKLHIVLEKVKESLNMDKSDLNQEYNQDQDISKSNNKETNNGEKNTYDVKRDLQTDDPRLDMENGIANQILNILNKISEDLQTQIHSALELLTWLTVQVMSSLPDDIRPGPDLYGVPWEPIIISGLVGLVTILVFVYRCYSSVKSRMYRSKERWMAEQVAQLLDEKCKVLETLSKCQQEYDEIEDSLRDSGVLAQTQKTIQLETSAKQLEHIEKEFEKDLEKLKDQLNQQREHRLEQEQRIMALEESIKTCEEETKMFQSQEEQAQTTLKVYSMNSDRLQRNLETAGEENALLQENNTHLRQQLEGWAERVSELEEEMRRCEISHSGMLQDVATKDERIMSLTDRLLRIKAWDSDEEEQGAQEGEMDTSNGTARTVETNGKGNITDPQGHLQKVQKLIYAAKLNADLKSVDEDKDRVFAKLNDEIKAKEDLQESIKDLESEKLSMQSDTKHYSDQVQLLQQKLQIMTEMYQENELKLHRLLTVEEKERLQKEEKLTKADKNIAMAMEELNNYRQRAGEMEEELEKTKQSYQTQISSHEKKAHNNWLAARSAERELAEKRRENALCRQKLTDTQFKLEALEKDPYALDSLARPMPFRAERSPYGPSPLGRPSSETRPFLSPPTLMDGPPNRLSPRVMPPGGPVEMGSGGAHSDSGSISPTWERDRRGPPPGPMPGPPGPIPPPGYIFPEPGGPMYRRPPPGPMGLHPPGSFPPRGGVPLGRPPGAPLEMPDAPFRENSFGPGEHELREPVPGDRRTPPEGDPTMGGVPPPGPVMGPIDGPFPRRAPYGPPPPDYYLPRGPGGPPMPVWGHPPPEVMYPPRFPPGGPPPPHMPPYSGPPRERPPVPDGHSLSVSPSQPPVPAPTQRQSSVEHTPSPQDII